MDTFLINKFLHKKFAYVIAVFLYIFIFYMVFEHMFDLTKLVVQYNSAFDYGKYTKSACANEFFEYETERFHVNQGADDMKLSNTANKKRYITLILVLAIIMTLFISFTFSYILYNTFFNKDWFYDILDIKLDAFEKGKDINSTMFQRAFAYIIHVFTLLYSPIKIITGLFYKLFLTADNGAGLLTNIILFVIVVIIYLLVAAAVVIMPVYIGLKMGLNIDISPFNTNYQVYVPYIVAFVLIIVIRLSFLYFKYSEVYIENYSPITEYFSSNVSKMYTANNMGGYIGFFAIFATYIVMFYILGNIINIHNNPPQEEEKELHDNVNVRTNIMESYMSKTIGYGEFNNYQLSNVFVKNLSGVTFTMIIIIIVMLVLHYAAQATGGNDNVQRLLKYGIITPLAFLTIITMTSSATTEFNSIVNDYILEFPNKVYRQYIDILNKMFNNILNKEYTYADSVAPQYVCRNVGNAIVFTLFNELFYGVPKISRTGDDNGAPIDITPEFKYDDTCEYIEPFDFTGGKEYDMSYYINGKDLKKNIFYNYNKCSQVNTAVLETITSNLQIFDSAQLAEIMKSIQMAFYVAKPLQTDDPIQYIKLQIVEKNIEANINVDNLRNELKRKIHKCIFNVKNNFTCANKDKSLITSKDDKYYQNGSVVNITEMEIDAHNNKIDVVLPKASAEQVVDGFQTIVDDIIDIYMNNIYYHLYTFTPFFVKLNINKNTEGISEDDDKYQVLQDTFIKGLTDGICKTFDKIKEKLSMPLIEGNTKTMTSYIIANYNSIHPNKIYRKEHLQQIDVSVPEEAEDESKTKNIKIFNEIFNSFSSIYIDKLRPLFASLKTNEHKNVKFVVQLKNMKMSIGNLKEELNKYKFDKSFQADVNSIFRDEDNKYNRAYDIFYVEKDRTKNEFIDSAYDAINKMMDLTIILVINMEAKHNLLVKKSITNKDKETIDLYSSNIERYANIIDTNNYALKNDIINHQTLVDNLINTTRTLSDMNIDLSRNTLKESIKVDQLIYLVCVNYIISIILTNFIYNI